jgi:hypothetical protein
MARKTAASLPIHKPLKALSRSALDFASIFTSGDELRKAFAVLLGKMGKKNVQITHGQQEYGKDLVFYDTDSFGSDSLMACVIKNAKITGSVDSANGAKNVLFQVEQALDTPHISSSGANEHVAKVFVVSPHPCDQTPMRSIQGKLKQRSGQVTFLCGTQLFDLFNSN